jgi:hypothetical protein
MYQLVQPSAAKAMVFRTHLDLFRLLVAFVSISATMASVVLQMSKSSLCGDSPDVSFDETLPPETLALLHEYSPHYMAYQWIQQDDLFLMYPLWRQHGDNNNGLRSRRCILQCKPCGEDQFVPWFRSDVNECNWLWNSDEPLAWDSSGRYIILSL